MVTTDFPCLGMQNHHHPYGESELLPNLFAQDCICVVERVSVSSSLLGSYDKPKTSLTKSYNSVHKR